MLHTRRVWSVYDSESVDALTEALAGGGNWALCQGFRLDGYLFLNDSISEDSIVEFGVVREADMQQVESITFGWCGADKTRQYIERSLAGELNYPCGKVRAEQIEPAQGHKCRLCA